MQTTPGQISHASMVVIQHQGILITGPSGIGKSELCLQLLDRGHQFVCDDMLELTAQETRLLGSAPSALLDKLAIRDVGVINITTQFKPEALVAQHYVDWVVELHTGTPHNNPVDLSRSHTTIEGITLPKFSIGNAPKRPVALLLEVIAHTFFPVI